MSAPTKPNPFASCETIQETLGQLAGAASVCWENLDRAGVFQSEQASAFVDAAKSKIIDLIGEDESPALFPEQLRRLLNRNGIDTKTSTPDHVLASYLIGCIGIFQDATDNRERWFGHRLTIGGATAAESPTETLQQSEPESTQ